MNESLTPKRKPMSMGRRTDGAIRRARSIVNDDEEAAIAVEYRALEASHALR